MSRSSLVVALALLFTSGCGYHNNYNVEITPDGQAFQRKLTCWRTKSGDSSPDAQFPADELAAIAALYPQRLTPPDANEHVFSGRFAEKTPADVGGSGTYVCFETPLGSTFAYSERFRGNDDVSTSLKQSEKDADGLVDLLLGWLQAELRGEAGFDKLRSFVDIDLRKDAKNLLLYAWLNTVTAPDRQDDPQEFYVRAAQYLAERGYFSPREVPALLRTIGGNDSKKISEFLARFVAGKLGIAADAPLPEPLVRLQDPQRFEKSWNDYVRTTEEFQERMKSWAEGKLPGAAEPKPDQFLGEKVAALLFAGQLFRPVDAVSVSLKCSQQPYSTNGKWEAGGSQVVWSLRADRLTTWPTLCFAFWSEPNADEQKLRFGRLVLSGQQLANYALWYKGLTDREVGEWDALIASLSPDRDIKGKLEGFQFSAVPGQPPATANEAVDGRKLILDGLRGEKP